MNKLCTHSTLILCLVLSLNLAGCFSATEEPVANQEPDSESRQDKSEESQPQGNPSSPSPHHGQPTESNRGKEQSFCETISADQLTSITGQTYHQSRQTANFTNIKHCEHMSQDGQFSLSVLVAFDQTAEQRLQQNEQYGNLAAQENFGDQCFWQPDLGMLYAKFGNRYLEARISKSHGTEQARIQWSKEIIQLVLKHY